jgi:beta-phosphoglucomutase
MIRAVIFDLDGTLADTETLHYAAFTEVLRPEGIELSRADYFARLIGYDDHDCFEAVLKENGKDASEAHIARLAERKTASYMEVIRTR